MQRIPKYTAGMFKKKMPRFGASGIKMPRMPRMPKPSKPRIKKLAGGGEIEEVILGDGDTEKVAQAEYLRRNPQYRTPEPGLENVYPETLIGSVGVIRGLAKTAANKRKAELLAKIAKRQETRGAGARKVDIESLKRSGKDKSLADKAKKELEDLKAYFKENKAYPVPVIGDYESNLTKPAPERKKAGGGKIESCCRGDGIAKRGKTRGKFV